MYRLVLTVVCVVLLSSVSCKKKVPIAHELDDVTYYAIYEEVARAALVHSQATDAGLLHITEEICAKFKTTADEFRRHGSELYARDKEGYVVRTREIMQRLHSAE